MDLEKVKEILTQAGWIVKDGTLYGSEFMLYKESNGHTHAKYLVKLIERMDYRQVLALIRTCKSVNKVILI
jgi:tRNA splicing endonuclease